ncbi:TVP38/TMEM64 family protein [Marinobacter sp.]|uniref:TVP38/TMEM64 family protein n=1 Tax=Marinobacter sp. TaxID=50741 RepID=UPI0035C6BF32|nr:VTT domain-containing protein [Oleiphilaceae bacterium]
MPRTMRWLLFGSLVIIAYVSVYQGWLDFISDKNQVAEYIQSQGIPGLLVTTLVAALFTGIGAPRQILAFVLGFALGGMSGALLSTLATALGASGCFFTARWLLQTSIYGRLGSRMRVIEELLQEQTLLKILMIRLLPVGSNLATNLVAGCSNVRFPPFLIGSTFGYFPQMLVFALAGAGIGNADQIQLALSAALFVIASLIGTFLYHCHKSKVVADTLSRPF